MGNNRYFQRGAREIGSSAPVLQPPRYLSRRMETGQVNELGANRVASTPYSTPSPTGRQDNAPLAGVDAQALPPAEGGLHAAVYQPAVETKIEPYRIAYDLSPAQSNLTAARTFEVSALTSSMGSKRAGDRLQAGVLPAQVGNVGEINHQAIAQLDSLPVCRPAPPFEHAVFSANNEAGKAQEALAYAEPATVVTNTANDIDSSTPAQTPSATQYANWEPGSDRPYLAVVRGEAQTGPSSAKTLYTSESLSSIKQEAEIVDTQISIGTLEIKVVSSTQPADRIKTGTASSRLSLTRGVSRGYGLRQG